MRFFRIASFPGGRIHLLCGFLALGLWQCFKTGGDGEIVAQVGNSTLTLEELKDNFPPEFAPLLTKEQYFEFVRRWINEEILYQKALEEKIHLHPDVERRFREQKKKLVVEEFTARVNRQVDYTPDESSISQYYELHRDEFVRDAEEIKIAVILVEDERTAWRVREQVTSDNFLALQQEHSRGVKNASLQELRFQRRDDVDPCMLEQAFGMRIGGTSRPISCGDEWALVRVIDTKGAGSLQSLEEVREAIRDRLATKMRQVRLQDTLEVLKSDIFYSYNLELIPGKASDAEQEGTGTEGVAPGKGGNP